MRALALLKAPGNALAFALRNTLRWRRGAPQLRDESKHELFAYLPPDRRRRAEARATELCARYGLAALRARSTRADYRDNLALLDVLERATAGLGLPQRPRVCDVGCKNWNYVFALARCFAPELLVGYEIDPYPVYRDLHSRADWAQAYIAQVQGPEVRYEPRDFLRAQAGEFDVVTLLFPFVTRHALLHWGLPLRCFRPQQLLARARAVLRPGGLLLSLHQTRAEAAIAARALADLGSGMRQVDAATDLVHYAARTADRVALVARMPG